MARLYAATGDGIARLDESGEAWTVELSVVGSGAQCVAVDPDDPGTVYAGLREGGVQRTADAGRSWVDCTLPESGVFSVAVSAADGAVYARTEPARREPAPGRDRTRRPDALHRRRRELARPLCRCAAGRALARLASAVEGAGLRGGRRPRCLQRRRRRELAAGRRGPRPQLHLVGHRRPGRPRLLVRVGEHRPLRRTRRPRPAGAHLPTTRWRTVAATRRRAAGAAAGD